MVSVVHSVPEVRAARVQNHSGEPLTLTVEESRAPMPNRSSGGLAILLLGLQITRLVVAQLGGRSYIDPGSGSFAIQIIIAAVLGGLLSARLWFRHVVGRIIGWFRRSTPEASPAAEEARRDDG